MDTRFAVVIGLDVGKSGHHAYALDPDGNKLFVKPLPHDEGKLRGPFTSLQEHGEVLMVVDQPSTIGALPIAVARDTGCAVVYLPGLAMRKVADLYTGRSKTDTRDVFVIADAARTAGPPRGRSTATARSCPHSRSWQASMRTSPTRPPGRGTGSGRC